MSWIAGVPSEKCKRELETFKTNCASFELFNFFLYYSMPYT